MSRIIENKIFDVDTPADRLRIYIKSKLKVYEVIAVGRVVIEREEFCASRLTFTVKKDSVISFNQGDAVSVKMGETGLFFGYVFSKSRNKNSLIEVVAYDQMRYMKNKVCYSRGIMSLEEVIYSLKSKYGFNLGEVDKCKVMLLPFAGENVSLLDVVKKGCADVLQSSGEKYILFDDFGYLSLKNENELVTNVYVDGSQSEDYVYTDTIDKGVYNKVVLYMTSKKMGAVTAAEYTDEDSVDKLGELIYTKKVSSYQSGAEEAKNLLKEYSKINREILLKGIMGNSDIIPGCRIWVRLNMGELALDGFMRVKKVRHIFENNLYKADVYLDGSEIE